MPLKAVLFDMDGVIVDTEPLHRKAYYKMFADLGISVSSEIYESFTGMSTQKANEKLIELFSLSQTPEELNSRKRVYFKELFDSDPDFGLLPGVRDLIENYFENGIKLVLASSASMNTINWVFERFGLEKFFMGKISGADLRESKPHPEIFLKAVELAGEPRKNCMVIEDSTNGIIAAHRAKIFCAAYKSANSKGQDYSLANITAENFSELRLEKIQKYFA